MSLVNAQYLGPCYSHLASQLLWDAGLSSLGPRRFADGRLGSERSERG